VKLSFEQHLPASPGAVWPFITDPELMNRWSAAHIDRVAPGDTAMPGDVGELRRVTVRSLGKTVHFDEVIEHSEPEKRVVYRIIAGLPVRHHRGEITLAPERGGTLLRWDVEYAFLLSVMSMGAQAILVPQLRESLGALARVCEDAPTLTYRRRSWFDEGDDDPGVLQEAQRIHEEQRAIADRMEAEGDPKQWFARVYEYVTETQIASCRAGRTTHKGWVLRLIPRFHACYIENLRRFTGEEDGPVEHHWRGAFSAMERAESPGEVFAVGLLLGVRAHIEQDLPRMLADVYIEHYARRCGYGRFRADFLLMQGILRRAADRLLKRVSATYLPPLAWMLGPMVPPEARDAVMARRFYNITRARRTAFDRGAAIVAARLGSHAPSGMITSGTS
jgi:uncharacterized protein YndB with AHSA1/START domain